jgi:hypothetical protein
MRAMAHIRSERNEYFHLHPWHTLFTLIASAMLAALVVLALVGTLK